MKGTSKFTQGRFKKVDSRYAVYCEDEIDLALYEPRVFRTGQQLAEAIEELILTKENGCL